MESSKDNIEVLETQAKNGNAESARQIGDHLINADKPKAMHYYALAADLGDKVSLGIIADFLKENGDQENSERARELSKESKTSSLTLTGLALVKASNHQKAEEFFRKAVIENDRDSEAWCSLGFCYAMRKDFYSAKRAYENAYKLTKSNKSIKGLALTSKELGQRDEAIQYCKQYRAMFNDGEVDNIYNELLEPGTGSVQNGSVSRTYAPNKTYSTPHTPTYQYNRPVYNKRKTSGITVIARWIFVVLAIVGLVTKCTGNSSPSSTSPKPATPSQVASTNPDANLTEKGFNNGQLMKRPKGERIAPFEVKAAPGAQSNAYIYLKDVSSNGANDMAFMVKAGQTAEIDVPYGTYVIYYASGEKWYGSSHKFGANTYYCKFDGTLQFYQSGDYAMGHTLTLYAVSGGNASSDEIDESAFPG